MSMTDWRSRAGTVFAPTKRPATGSRGMVVTNHPLASAAGAEMLAEGGNAVDAGIAALFALSVVEPMMVGLLGGGMAHLRLPDGTHTVLDGLSTVPAAGRADMYTPVSQDWPAALETVGRANAVGATSVATPGNLLAWCAALERHGSLPLADVMAPAIRLAARGFAVTPYLAECVSRGSGRPGARSCHRRAAAARRRADPRRCAAGERCPCRDAGDHRGGRTPVRCMAARSARSSPPTSPAAAAC